MQRRRFISLLGGAAVAWPFAARAQQPAALPVIGFLSTGSPRTFSNLMTSFNEGLEAEGFVHGRNILIDYRWVEGHYDELSTQAAELVRRKVALIAATGGSASAQAAIRATTTIPIVFVIGVDPVQLGLVASLNNPGGNATGVLLNTTEIVIKRLDVLAKLVPKIRAVAFLVNPASISTRIEVKEIIAGASTLGLTVLMLEIKSESEFESAFNLAVTKETSAVLVQADPFFNIHRTQIVALAARHALPVMYAFRAYVDAGGLVSYGPQLSWAYYQAGVYTGRIMKGTKPTELPVMLPTNFDLVINLNTAKTLGLTVPPALLAGATDVIE
jgi:putative ABC transport system substrate-binding protein